MTAAPRTALVTAVLTSSAVPRGTVSNSDWSKGLRTGIFSSRSTQLPFRYIFMVAASVTNSGLKPGFHIWSVHPAGPPHGGLPTLNASTQSVHRIEPADVGCNRGTVRAIAF